MRKLIPLLAGHLARFAAYTQRGVREKAKIGGNRARPGLRFSPANAPAHVLVTRVSGLAAPRPLGENDRLSRQPHADVPATPGLADIVRRSIFGDDRKSIALQSLDESL